ncbi:MAG: transketolase [Elusimicrobia bacterium]|nr:transketolase [Elusimicrobiota bacterium]
MSELVFVGLDEIKRLQNLATGNERRMETFAAACRINTLYMIMKAGSGHVGTSFSSMDILTWLYLKEKQPEDIVFSSKGHDAPAFYSILIGLGLLDFGLLHNLRRLGGLAGHPDIATPHIETNTGSLGMGISKAKGIILARRLKGEKGRVFVINGDGELQEGQIWESMFSAANLKLGELTAIVDHNKIQSDTWVHKVNDLGNLEAKFRNFGWHVLRCDGHNYSQLADTFSRLSCIDDKPKALIADTIKGKGVAAMEHTSMKGENELYHFHSGAPGEAIYTKGVAELIEQANSQLRALGAAELKTEKTPKPDRTLPQKPQRLISTYSQALLTQAEQNQRIVVLDADLMHDCGLTPFKSKFPQRFFECGIAEQDMVSMAGGMASRGALPIVHSFACFLSSRPNEQIYNNASERKKIIYVGSLAGLLPSGPGHSHQAVRDIAALSAIPGLILIEPSNELETNQALDFCVNQTAESCYLRLISLPCETPYQLPADYRLRPGRGVALTEGEDAVLFSYGPIMLSEAYRASNRLRQHGIGLKVVNLPWLNRIDVEWLGEIVSGCPWIFTLDNHYIKGGQGEFILASLMDSNLGHIRVQRFGLTDIPACGTNEEVLKFSRLDAESLSAAIETTIKKPREHF